MAWATRSDRDSLALKEYVRQHASAIEAWQSVPGLNVTLDKTRVEAALDKRERQIQGQSRPPRHPGR